MMRRKAGLGRVAWGWLIVLALAVPLGAEWVSPGEWGVPAAGPEACICFPDPDRYNLDVRDVVFSGTVIGSEGGTSIFLVRDAWKGVEGDTIHVTPSGTGNCGPMYWVGGAYLLFADRENGRTVTPECGGSEALGASGPQLEELGPPVRSFSAETRERLAAGMILPGDAVPEADPGVRLDLYILDEDGVVWDRPVRIGGREQATNLTGQVSFSGLPEGFYRGEVALEDDVHEFYVLVACVPLRSGSGGCYRARKTLDVREVEPGDRHDFLRENHTFTPRTEGPRLLNEEEVEARIEAQVPGSRVTVVPDRDSSRPTSSGSLVVWIYVDEDGAVQNARIHNSSGIRERDQAVRTVMHEALFEPAQMRDRLVPAWVLASVKIEGR
jgi:TonB family protein